MNKHGTCIVRVTCCHALLMGHGKNKARRGCSREMSRLRCVPSSSHGKRSLEIIERGSPRCRAEPRHWFWGDPWPCTRAPLGPSCPHHHLPKALQDNRHFIRKFDRASLQYLSQTRPQFCHTASIFPLSRAGTMHVSFIAAVRFG